jgi:hypothetical protein
MFDLLIIEILLEHGLAGTPAVEPATLVGLQLARLAVPVAGLMQHAEQGFALLVAAELGTHAEPTVIVDYHHQRTGSPLRYT